MTEPLPLVVVIRNEVFADSRAIAQCLGMDHDHFLDHIADYQREIERRYDLIQFALAPPPESVEYALLTDAQAMLALSYLQHYKAQACRQRVEKRYRDVVDQLQRAEYDQFQHVAAWTAFLEAWHRRFGSDLVLLAEVAARLRAETSFAKTLPETLKTALDLPQPASFTIRLGRALGMQKNTPFGPRRLVIQQERDTHQKMLRWCVVSAR